MSTLTKIPPKDTAAKINAGEAVLIDIREADEYAREHIEGARSLPASTFDSAQITLNAGQHAIFHCKSGMRTDSHCERLSTLIDGEAMMLEGGLDAWRSNGLPTIKNTKAPLEINRQVQITAGSLILAGFLLGHFLQPEWHFLSGIIGAGLMFAGISGWCGMGKLLAIMPWNKTAQ